MMKQIVLPSGFRFDYTNICFPYGITKKDLEELELQIAEAHKAAQHMKKTGEVPGHLSKDGEPEAVLFSTLPYIEEGNILTPEHLDELEAFGEYCKKEVGLVVSFGIGGSYLGSKVIFDTHCGEFWNESSESDRNGYPKLYFSGNNVDPYRTSKLVERLVNQYKRKEVEGKALLLVFSKSGGTIEPMSNFMIVEKAFRDEGIDYEVVAITDLAEGPKETVLHKMAVANGWRLFNVPDGVGGRFSVFSDVGLVVGAAVGFPIRQFLQGARDMDEVCKVAPFSDNPALLSAALKFVAREKYGRNVEIMMPYGDALQSFSEWYVQLLAESLGKEYTNKPGKHYGRTPVVAVGTRDMHAQTQDHQEGALDKWVQFVEVEDWGVDCTVPDLYPDYPKVHAMSGISLGTILKAALDSNAEALASVDRFNARIVLPKFDAYYLGQLMFMLCWAIFYEGQLAGVDAFNQPGVEVYKRLLGPKLAAEREA